MFDERNDVLLIEWKQWGKKQRRFNKDPYALRGEEKKKCLSDLAKYITSYQEENNNPDEIDKTDYYYALQYLEAETSRRINRLINIEKYYYKEKMAFISTAIEEFKQREKIAFMNKYKDNIAKGNFTVDMVRDMTLIEKREKSCCYSIKEGFVIIAKDCTTCANKCMR